MLKPTMVVRLLRDTKHFKDGDEAIWYDTFGDLAYIGSNGAFEYVELNAFAPKFKSITEKIRAFPEVERGLLIVSFNMMKNEMDMTNKERVVNYYREHFEAQYSDIMPEYLVDVIVEAYDEFAKTL